MKTSTEQMEGVLVDAIATTNDANAHDQLMHRTGEFFNMLDHVARNHPKVITGEYLGDVLDDVDYIGLKYSLPEPIHPNLQ
jgi:hypothetical protein